MSTEKTYNGHGSDTTFDITFPYLTHADIGVSVGGVTKTVGSDYSITGDTVTFTTAPASGTNNVKLYRNTNIDTPEHEYSAGSSITAARLNENQKQALYAIEEAKLVTTTSGGITTGNKNDITVNSDTDWVIRTDAVEKSMMADNSVGTDQIETNAVTAAEIAVNAVGASELAPNAVYTAAIVADAVNGTKIADDSIDSEHIVADSIDTEHYAPVSIDSDAIADNAVVQNKIGNDSVNEARLQISNTPDNKDGYVLTAESGNTGGLTWAVAPTVAGSILETVSYICDGVSFTQRGVTYNSTAVTAAQTLTTTYAPVTGSTITYTPPSGAKQVIYEFTFLLAPSPHSSTPFPLPHVRLFLGGVEVTKARMSSYTLGDIKGTFKWVFPIGGTADSATGRLNTWGSAKAIKLEARGYGAQYMGKFHETYHWDGEGANSSTSYHLSLPMITITAIS